MLTGHVSLAVAAPRQADAGRVHVWCWRRKWQHRRRREATARAWRQQSRLEQGSVLSPAPRFASPRHGTYLPFLYTTPSHFSRPVPFRSLYQQLSPVHRIVLGPAIGKQGCSHLQRLRQQRVQLLRPRPRELEALPQPLLPTCTRARLVHIQQVPLCIRC